MNTELVKQQAHSFANKVMGMNRKDRRAFSKNNKMEKIAGSNTPYVKANETRKEVR